jgi:hypothetical protein
MLSKGSKRLWCCVINASEVVPLLQHSECMGELRCSSTQTVSALYESEWVLRAPAVTPQCTIGQELRPAQRTDPDTVVNRTIPAGNRTPVVQLVFIDIEALN